MLFTNNRQTSQAMLQLAAAGFILLVPSLLGFLSINAGVYFIASAVLLLMALRIKNQEKISFSLLHFVFLLLGGYGAVSSLWANNREGQLVFLAALIGGAVFYSLTFEYFAENADGGIGRRMMNMLSMSAFLCAVINVIYWLLYIVPVAGNEALGSFLGTSDFTAVFMGIGIIVSCMLMKGSSKAKLILLILGALVMAFVFVMGKSSVAWIFTIATALILFIKKSKKYEKHFAVISLILSAVFAVAVFCMLWVSSNGDAFRDVLSYGGRNIFGHGGGFWSGRQTFLSTDYPRTLGVGLMAYLFASSGVLGIISCIVIVARNVMLVIKTKTAESTLALLVTVLVMLIPFGGNFAVVLLWLGFTGYVEQSAGFGSKLQIKKQKLEKTLFTLYVIIIISIMLLLLSLIKMSADRAYKRKDYDEAYSLYKTAATINLSDGESLRMAAASMRKGGRLEENYDEALRIINTAIKRDSDNLENLREKALIYEKCGEFELGAQQYRDASQRAFIKGRYNLDLAKILYKIVKKAPKGSSETKRAYEEIVSIAAITEDLDLRKEINDIADKALRYTKGELSNEG